MNAHSLKSRAMQGGVWLAAGGGAEQGLRLVRNMILARILAPEVFGVMAIISAVNAALEGFTQVGIKEAIIQDPHAEEDSYLNGAWWISFARSILLLMLGVIGSFWIVSYFRIPDALRIIQLSFLSILFNGSLSARAYTALKAMNYSKWAIINHGGGIFGIVISLALSFKYSNVNALVIGLVAEGFARCLLSYLLCPYVPRLQFEGDHLKRLISYARGMVGLPILYLVYSQMPIFVIGRLLPQKEVGLYSMVASLAQAPVMLMTIFMNQLLMPAFASRQDDTSWLNMIILKSTRIIAWAGFPVACYVVVYGGDLLTVIYGPQYAIMSLPFALLFIATVIGACSIPIVNVYLAVGQPRLQRLFSGVRAVAVVLLIYPAIRLLGTTGAAIAVGISMGVSYFFQVHRMRMLTGLDTAGYWRIVLHGVGIALVVLLIWYSTYNTFFRMPVGNLALGIFGCMFAYGIFGAIYFRAEIVRKYSERKASGIL